MIGRILLGVIVLYLFVAYLVLPWAWNRYARLHPELADLPRVTHTANEIPGDPLNVALIGSELEVNKLMVDAKWFPADPLTLRSCLRIASATVLRRPYEEAPVSNLYLFNRKQDLAFEQPVGDDPRKRHHVRFWKAPRTAQGREIWVGAVTYDDRVGLSYTTGQITHHIAPDIDAERNRLMQQWQQTGSLLEEFPWPDFHTVHEGRNGGGDPWHTDGSLGVGVLKPGLLAK